MVSIFDTLRTVGAAAFVVKAIVTAMVLDGLLLGFILLRRTYRKRFFAKRDARLLDLRRTWDDVMSGKIPYESWRKKPYDRRIIESVVLDALEIADASESARLLAFLRSSGLIEKLIFDARNHKGWRRQRALFSLGRTRAPEAIPALGEALRAPEPETRLSALRGLGRTACPEGAKEILDWLLEAGLKVPTLPVQMALIQSCAERPQVLLPYFQHTDGPVREVLGRVLGEVATAAISEDLLQFVEDDVPELRAAAARAFCHGNKSLGLDVLLQLARDPVWFVRLRAMVSLGSLCEPGARDSLIEGLTDANRLVRLRAAEALVKLEGNGVKTLERVLGTQDRYALHAYVTALENASCVGELERQIKLSGIDDQQKNVLLDALRKGERSAKPLHGAEIAIGQATSS